jgi:hypothetical protein
MKSFLGVIILSWPPFFFEERLSNSEPRLLLVRGRAGYFRRLGINMAKRDQ